MDGERRAMSVGVVSRSEGEGMLFRAWLVWLFLCLVVWPALGVVMNPGDRVGDYMVGPVLIAIISSVVLWGSIAAGRFIIGKKT